MARKTIFKAKIRRGSTTAEHYKDGDHDFVKIGNLRVLVTNDGPWWFARGVEIDCDAQGHSLEEVKDKFVRSLTVTAHCYLDEFGSIQKMLRATPSEVLAELANASAHKLLICSSESEHEIEFDEPVREITPFSGISFFQKLASPPLAGAMA